MIAATHTAQLAADRARTLADIVRDRAPLNPARNALLAIAAHLGASAEAFETDEPFVIEGVTVTNTIPADAAVSLHQAQTIAEDNPRIAYLRHVIDYVTAPITRRLPEHPPLNPVSNQLARQESGLRTRIALAAHDLDRTTDPTTRHAVLANLADLHRSFNRLADAVAVDNARPCNRPA
ncbi:hypothetical protein PH213_20440 [Streptomyces sp. SRF1]|uniref:hypothetical protein n=1 Tax=Streptomyces sp. SRF1 TaxID=1549642 RepID=UPI0025B1A488|nr:hypothetical protein [Streptomyces sp. SRF1]MDN3056876.1 hypothetical protein [Streptomyces sp. SRF1]